MSKITITTREYDINGQLTREVVEEKNVPEVMAPNPYMPVGRSVCSTCGVIFTGTHACYTWKPTTWTYTS